MTKFWFQFTELGVLLFYYYLFIFKSNKHQKGQQDAVFEFVFSPVGLLLIHLF